MPVLIHEFSRAFEPSNDPVYGWVSVGYSITNPIFMESAPVPEVIVKAVEEEMFAINDNYRPNPGDYALIARDVYDIDGTKEKYEDAYRNAYSVLAVANCQRDEIGRETTGYRYFWLDGRKAAEWKFGTTKIAVKNFLEIDGIQTLLTWWWRYDKNTRLMFSMEEAGLRKYNLKGYEINSGDKIFHLDKQDSKSSFGSNLKIRLKLSDMELSDMEDRFNSILTSHINTMKLCPYLYPLSWAYNVRKLEKPDAFLGIFYSPDASIQDSYSFPPAKDDRRVSENTVADSTNTDEFSIMEVAPDIRSIQSLITKVARKYTNSRDSDFQEIKTLLDYKLQYSNYDWQNFIDPTTVQQKTVLAFVYKALLYILCPEAESVQNWYQHEFIPAIDDRVRSPFYKNNPNDRLALALGIQTAIFDEIMSHERSEELQSILLIGIYDSIKDMLENLYEIRYDEVRWERHKYLLSVDSILRACWQEYTKSCYTDNLFYFHLKREFWDSKQLYWLKEPEADWTDDQSLRVHFKTLHQYILGLIDRANNLREESTRQEKMGNYKAFADVLSNLDSTFHSLFSRLSGYKVKRRLVEQQIRDRLNRILLPVQKRKDDDIDEIFLLLLLGLLLAIFTFFLPQPMDLYFIIIVGIMVFISSNFKRSGNDLLIQFFLVFISLYLSAFLFIPMPLIGYVIIIFLIAMFSFVIFTFSSNLSKKGGYR